MVVQSYHVTRGARWVYDTLTKWYLTPKYKSVEVIKFIKPGKYGVDPQGISLI